MEKCRYCKAPLDIDNGEGLEVWIQVSPQTHWEPAEQEPVYFCDDHCWDEASREEHEREDPRRI